jgi:RNA recognition motif-containing protein
MKSIKDSNGIFPPSVGDDRLKIFLSNLDGRINTQDLHTFFSRFGPIEHIESWTPKSAIILYSDIDSIDRVLSKHRKCIINKQEIFIRRFRYGYIERAYMDTTVLFIKPVIHDLSIEWNDTTIRNCFHKYEIHIEQIRLVPKCLHAFIHFKDYDIVDRILLQSNMFSIDGITIKMSRAKCNENNEFYIKKLLEKNQVLKKQIQRKMREFGLFFFN